MSSNCEQRFLLHTQRIVARALKNNNYADFDQLIRVLPGIYPTDVARALSSLGMSLPPGAQTSPKYLSKLPIAHPADSAWRFSAPTIDQLSDRCIQATKNGDTILLLGVPEVFLRLRARKNHRKLVLMDKDPLVVEAVSKELGKDEEVMAIDLADAHLRDYGAACVLADPPWYMDYFRLFTWFASQNSRKGAPLLLPLPGVGSRPQMAQERRLLLRWLRILAYEMQERIPRTVVYDSPFFEQNALRAAGLVSIDKLWRRCDLAVLTLSANVNVGEPSVRESARWREFVCDGVRIRILVNTCSSSAQCDSRLISLVPGDILPSVSSRHPLRPYVQVWTSGNRVYGCHSPSALVSVCEAFTKGCCAESQVSVSLARDLEQNECQWVRTTVEQLKRLISDERRDRDLHSAGAVASVALES
jgi:hypothetical protein